MKTQPSEPTHDMARALFEVRTNLAATRAALDEDSIGVHPIFGTAISNTCYRSDGLLISKKRARKFIQDAYLSISRFVNLAENSGKPELMALAIQIMDTIHITLYRLCKDNVASDEDRIAARKEVERPWQLSKIAIGYFVSTEPECAPQNDDHQN